MMIGSYTILSTVSRLTGVPYNASDIIANQFGPSESYGYGYAGSIELKPGFLSCYGEPALTVKVDLLADSYVDKNVRYPLSSLGMSAKKIRGGGVTLKADIYDEQHLLASITYANITNVNYSTISCFGDIYKLTKDIGKEYAKKEMLERLSIRNARVFKSGQDVILSKKLRIMQGG